MANSDLSIQISAINKASAEFKRLVRDLKSLDTATGQFNRTAEKTSGFSKFTAGFNKDIKNVALGFIGAQAAIGGFQAGIQGTIGAAVAFESSFAGIRKTVDATEAEFKALADANRAMARDLPISVINEINRIGELAGQLGVTGTKNIAAFERTIADVANTTDLTADSAATAFAQIANVMQLPIDQVDQLGSAIVDLGNKGAATESGIVDFTQRIAGAGKIAGLTTAEIAGVGSAFASVGIEAEAGGTAIQKVLIEMTKAAVSGGDELEAFAEAAGMTTTAFAQLAKSNPAEAFTRFVEGLGKAGDGAFQILERLNLEDQRLIRSFLSAAQAGDLLRTSIQTGTAAFRENTALTAEAEKRYATTAAQLQILKNNAIDAGIGIGNTLLPVINDSAQAGTELIKAAKPIGPALKAVATAAPLAAVGVLAFAAAMKAVKAAEFAQDVIVLNRQFPNLTRQMLGTRGAAQALTSAIASPTGAMIALTAAIVAVDVAARKFTGEGLIDHITGAKDAAQKAAREQEYFNRQLERTNKLVELLGESSGKEAALEDIAKRIDRAQIALEQSGNNLRDTVLKNTDAFVASAEHIRDNEEEINGLVDAVADLNPEYHDLLKIIEKYPVLQGKLNVELAEAKRSYDENAQSTAEMAQEQREFQRAMRDSATVIPPYTAGIRDLATWTAELARQNDELEGAMKKVADGFDAKTLDELKLDVAIADTEALIAAYEAAGVEVPAALTKWRDGLVANRTASETLAEAAVLHFGVWRKELTDTAGVAESTAGELAAVVNSVPEERRTKFIAEAQEFLTTASEIERFIDLIKKNPQLGVDLALRIAARYDEVQAERAGQVGNRTPGSRGADGFAKGGFVNAAKGGELAMLHGEELVLPLNDKRRSMDLLEQAGMRGFEGGGFTDLARGTFVPQGPSTSPGSKGDSPVTSAANEYARMAEQIKAAGMSATEFIARLELYEEQQRAVEEAQRLITESADRAAIDLMKVAIWLGQQGISGEALIAQNQLKGLREAYLESGMGMEEFTNSINGFTAALLERARELASRSGKAINSVNTGAEGYVDENGVRHTFGGNLTDEGLEKIRKKYPWIEDDDIKRTPAPSKYPKMPTATYNAPVTINNYDAADRSTVMGLR